MRPAQLEETVIVKAIRNRVASIGPQHTELTPGECVDFLCLFFNTINEQKLIEESFAIYSSNETFEWFALFVADQRSRTQEPKPWH